MKAFAIEGKTLSSKTTRILNFVSHVFEGHRSWNSGISCSITTAKQSLILYYFLCAKNSENDKENIFTFYQLLKSPGR